MEQLRRGDRFPDLTLDSVEGPKRSGYAAVGLDQGERREYLSLPLLGPLPRAAAILEAVGGLAQAA